MTCTPPTDEHDALFAALRAVVGPTRASKIETMASLSWTGFVASMSAEHFNEFRAHMGCVVDAMGEGFARRYEKSIQEEVEIALRYGPWTGSQTRAPH